MKLSLTSSLLCLLTSSSASAFLAPAPFVGRTAPSTTTTTTALNVAVDTSDIKNGLTVEIDGEPCKVIDFSVMKQARGAAKMTIKFKNLMRGNTLENTYRSGEKFQTAEVTRKTYIFSYTDESSDNSFFMDSETYEETMVEAKLCKEKMEWVGDGGQVDLVFFKGSVIEMMVPKVIVSEIIETEPNMKGNTSGAYTKPATLACGATINVPGYLSQGDVIKVDTEERKYMEKA